MPVASEDAAPAAADSPAIRVPKKAINPFGAATPIDMRGKDADFTKAKEGAEEGSEPAPAVVIPPSPQKSALVARTNSGPFGAAKPVDTASKSLEFER
jgi:hypothetical protein